MAKRCTQCTKAAVRGTSRCGKHTIDMSTKLRHTDQAYRQNRVYVMQRFEERPRHQQKCSLCGAGPIQGEIWAVDHIHPISRGGTHHISNLQVVHYVCNAVKYDRTMDECIGNAERRGRFLREVALRRS